MKIYYFSGATLPSDSAQSVHVMKMCRALAQSGQGHGVTLFAKTPAITIDDEGIFNYYGVPGVFSLILSRAPNIPVIRGMLKIMGHRWALQELGRPDLAYGRAAIEMDWLVADGVPFAFEMHQMPGSFFESRAVRNLLKRPELKAIVVISAALKNDLVKKYPAIEKKIIVLHDGADIQKEAAPKELAGRSDALKVVYTGSLHPGKGMEVLAVLAREAREFDFHVIGGSKEDVTRWQGRNLPPNIFMHGHVSHSELRPYMAAADILIAPYRSNVKIKSGRDITRWMSPMKIFEYMAAKKPIITADLPVIREVLRDGENAVLVSPDDVKAWMAGLQRLKSADLRETLAAQAFVDLKRHYTWQGRAATALKFVDKGS